MLLHICPSASLIKVRMTCQNLNDMTLIDKIGLGHMCKVNVIPILKGYQRIHLPTFLFDLEIINFFSGVYSWLVCMHCYTIIMKLDMI